MIPLAKILGDATEEVAANLHNATISGLISATFGNAVEMIMTVALLKNHEYHVVKSTLLGSVLSNMLLVLGMSFFFGGIGGKEKILEFSKIGALANAGMLLISAVSVTLISVFYYVSEAQRSDATKEAHLLLISRLCGGLIMSAYIAYIIFTLFTHTKKADLEKQADTKDESSPEAGKEEGDDDEDDEEPGLTLGCAIGLLCVVTVV